jgi:hypothetical protein
MNPINPVDSGVYLSLKALFDKVLVEISTAVPPGELMEMLFVRYIHLFHKG